MNHALNRRTGLTDQAGNARKRKKMRHGWDGSVASVIVILAIVAPDTKRHERFGSGQACIEDPEDSRQ